MLPEPRKDGWGCRGTQGANSQGEGGMHQADSTRGDECLTLQHSDTVGLASLFLDARVVLFPSHPALQVET